jgi:hypothetical protein
MMKNFQNTRLNKREYVEFDRHFLDETLEEMVVENLHRGSD